MKNLPTLTPTQVAASASSDRLRQAENERVEAYMRANPWNPRGAPAAPSSKVVNDPELTAINSRMADEQAQILASRRQQVAQRVHFGPHQAVAGNGSRPYTPLSESALDGRPPPSMDDEINARQALMASQYTNPLDPTQAAIAYDRLEHMPAFPENDPRVLSDPHFQRVRRS
jgi:hypothetical protein